MSVRVPGCEEWTIAPNGLIRRHSRTLAQPSVLSSTAGAVIEL